MCSCLNIGDTTYSQIGLNYKDNQLIASSPLWSVARDTWTLLVVFKANSRRFLALNPISVPQLNPRSKEIKGANIVVLRFKLRISLSCWYSWWRVTYLQFGYCRTHLGAMILSWHSVEPGNSQLPPVRSVDHYCTTWGSSRSLVRYGM